LFRKSAPELDSVFRARLDINLLSHSTVCRATQQSFSYTAGFRRIHPVQLAG